MSVIHEGRALNFNRLAVLGNDKYFTGPGDCIQQGKALGLEFSGLCCVHFSLEENRLSFDLIHMTIGIYITEVQDEASFMNDTMQREL